MEVCSVNDQGRELRLDPLPTTSVHRAHVPCMQAGSYGLALRVESCPDTVNGPIPHAFKGAQ